MTGKFIYFFLRKTWNISFHHVVHTVSNDMTQIVFTVFQNSARGDNSHRLGYGMCHFFRVLFRLKNKFLGLFYSF